jgi:hypothetical protein
MKIIYLLSIFFYIWSGYKIFKIRTYGYLDYKISTLLLSFSLFISAITSFWYNNIFYMMLPILPLILFLHKNNQLNKIKYKKNKIFIKK